MKVPQSVRWTYIRHGITKNPTRFLSIVFTKWVMDCAIHNGYVDVYVLTDGGCAASFDIKKTAWHCGVPGGDLTIVVNPDMLGGNCSDWRDLHASDHCVADLVAARDAAARQGRASRTWFRTMLRLQRAAS